MKLTDENLQLMLPELNLIQIEAVKEYARGNMNEIASPDLAKKLKNIIGGRPCNYTFHHLSELLLKATINGDHYNVMLSYSSIRKQWICWLKSYGTQQVADTSADAVAKLVIKLAEKGVKLV